MTEDESNPATVTSRKVLVVEDDRFIQEMLCKLLQQAGFVTERALDGNEALARATEFEPDLVLCDVMMPGLHGHEVCRRLKEQSGPVFLPVVFLTARDDLASKLEGFSVGADDYITKPFMPEEIVARIGVMLRLRDAQATILHLQRRKDEFLNIVSHDLKLPVSVISGFCRHLLSREAPMPPEDVDIISRIAANAEFMDRMIGYFLSRSALSSGRIELYPSRVRLPALVRECLRRSQILASNKEIRLVGDVGEDLPPVYIDENKIHQVLNNLLSNAIKFSPRGTEVRIAGTAEGKSVVLTVGDEGPGVPEQARERIFQAYEKSGTEATQPHEGSGLGLSISLRIVELHGGTLTVHPRDGGGSVFRITLPLKY